MSFKKIMENMLGPEKTAQLRQRSEREQQRKEELKSLSEEDLADKLEYCLVNCVDLQKHNQLGGVVYEAALIRIYIPEILRRLRGREEKPNDYGTLKKRLEEARKREQKTHS